MNDFKPPGPSDARSPCPALNTLANHGILPRDGRNITLTHLLAALDTYYLSKALRYALALPGLLLCGSGPLWARKLDLDKLAEHNKLEHDASLVHADVAPGAKFAPTANDPELLKRFVEACPASGMERATLAQIRAQRERESPSVPVRLLFIAASEGIAAFGRMGNRATGRLSRETIEAWFGENRFPEGWRRPEDEQTLPGILSETLKFRKEVRKALKEKED